MKSILRPLPVCLVLAAALAAYAGQAGMPSPDMIFDVRNGDQTGKLLIKDTELAFESLTDSRHSRNWKYTEIRSLEKPKKELRVRPVKGDRYDFQFKDKKLRDRLYDMISQKIVASRQSAR